MMVVSPQVERDSANFVKSLARGLAVIRAFDSEHPQLTLAEVARRAEIPAAAARRFLRTLQTLGYVRGGERFFSLTPKVLELGYSYLSSLSLPELMQPHLEVLSRTVGESVSGAVLSGAEIVYVTRVPTQRIMAVAITIGTRFPAAATSMGRMLLSGLPASEVDRLLEGMPLEQFTENTVALRSELHARLDEVRAQGWAMVEGELENGLRSIAAPIKDRQGTVVAAINVSASTSQRAREETLEEHLPLLLETAAAISRELELQ